MDAEQIQGIPAQPVCLGSPVLQEREGVFSQDLPSRRRPIRVRRLGEKIGNTLTPCGRHAVGHLQEDGMAAGRANGDGPTRPVGL